MSTVLLAEDDAGIADPLARALEREGYDVVQVDDGAEALRLANRLPVSVVVLDLGLPSLDGVDVCRTLREQGKDVPVLMLTARTEEIDIVVGLDAGADDYVAKPFRLNEVLARVRALMRRSPPDRLEVGPIVLDTGRPTGQRQRRGRHAVVQGVRVAPAADEPHRRRRAARADHGRGLAGSGIARLEDAGHAHVLAAPEADRRR